MEMLLPADQYLKSGIHIGTMYKTGFMKPYIFKTRQDRLNILDIQKINEKIYWAAKFLANYEPQNILAVGRRKYAQKSVEAFGKAIGAEYVAGRFVPGLLTNPYGKKYLEDIKVVIVSDPVLDKEAIMEAAKVHIPVIAVCNSNNVTSYIDLVIPGNNRGKRALAVIYYLLAREYLKNRGVIKSNEEFSHSIDDFEAEEE